MPPSLVPRAAAWKFPYGSPGSVRVLALDMYSELIRGPFDRETAAITRLLPMKKWKMFGMNYCVTSAMALSICIQPTPPPP